MKKEKKTFDRLAVLGGIIVVVVGTKAYLDGNSFGALVAAVGACMALVSGIILGVEAYERRKNRRKEVK